MGKTVTVLESRGGHDSHELRAHLPDCPDASRLPILFLLTTLAFLEATPRDGEGNEVDGWTPADFLSYLRFEEGQLKITLGHVRGRDVETHVSLSPLGELVIITRGRGTSADRWLSYVRGRRHLQPVAPKPTENA